MGKAQRDKGLNREREIVRDYAKIFTSGAYRIIESQQLKNREIKREGVDVVAGNLAIQSKRYKGYAPISAIEEIKALSHEIPILNTKPDYKPAIICMYEKDFKRIIQDIGVVYD